MNDINHCLIYTAIFIGIVGIIIVALYQQGKKETFITNQKVIWTYWSDSTLPPFIETCIGTWHRHNPDYTINIVNRKNLHQFVKLDITNLRHNDSITRESDFVRLELMATHGGYWIDASTICTRPLQEIPAQCEFMGYNMMGWNSDPRYPVLENWIFACIPGCTFVKKWRDEFNRMNEFLTVDAYINNVRQDTDLQGLIMLNYLAMHVAAQRVLQQGPVYTHSMHILDACGQDGPLSYLANNDWNTEKGVNSLCMNPIIPLVKFRGQDRKYAETHQDKLACLF